MSRAGVLFVLNMGVWTIVIFVAALVYEHLERRRRDREKDKEKHL